MFVIETKRCLSYDRSFVVNWAAQTFADWRCPATRQVFVASSAHSSKVQPVANPHGFSWSFNHDVLKILKKVIQKYDMNSWNMVLPKLMPWRLRVCTRVSCPAHVIQIFLTLLHDWAQQNRNPATITLRSSCRILCPPYYLLTKKNWKPPAATLSQSPHQHLIQRRIQVGLPTFTSFTRPMMSEILRKPNFSSFLTTRWQSKSNLCENISGNVSGPRATILAEGKNGSQVQFLRRFITFHHQPGAIGSLLSFSLCGGLIGLSRDHWRKSMEFHKELIGTLWD